MKIVTKTKIIWDYIIWFQIGIIRYKCGDMYFEIMDTIFDNFEVNLFEDVRW